jgi:RNA-directed DNA polymerase
MVFPPSPTTAHEHVAGHRQPGDTCAQEATRPGSQGTNSVRGTWCRAGDAGRHLRTTAGQAGNTPAGPGTPSPVPIPRRLERLATQARAYPARACTTLAHHLEVAMREDAFRRLTPRSAPGVDRVTWRAYKEHLATTLETFHEQRVNDTYCPQPVVRRLLPKSQGTLRPRGLPALEDKIVAKAVARLLEAIDAQDCCDASSGFRPGRSPHQALHDVRQGLLGNRSGQVIDCDISSFCDNVPHDTL